METFNSNYINNNKNINNNNKKKKNKKKNKKNKDKDKLTQQEVQLQLQLQCERDEVLKSLRDYSTVVNNVTELDGRLCLSQGIVLNDTKKILLLLPEHNGYDIINWYSKVNSLQTLIKEEDDDDGVASKEDLVEEELEVVGELETNIGMLNLDCNYSESKMKQRKEYLQRGDIVLVEYNELQGLNNKLDKRSPTNVQILEHSHLMEFSDSDIKLIHSYRSERWERENIEYQSPFPLEILLQVFTHLSAQDFHNCLLVCKGWNLLVKDMTLNETWGKLIKDELFKRLLEKSKIEIEIRFRVVERNKEIKQHFSRNITHLLTKLQTGLEKSGFGDDNFLLFSLLFKKTTETLIDENLQPFAPISMVFEFILFVSIHALDFQALLYRFSYESTDLQKTTIPLNSPIAQWVTSKNSPTNILRSICRHFSLIAFKTLKRLSVLPVLYSRYVIQKGEDSFRDPQDKYWLFDFSNHSEDCPKYIQHWITQQKQQRNQRRHSIE